MKNFIKRQIALREITKERKKELAITMRFANNKRTPLAPEEIKRAKDYWGIAIPRTKSTKYISSSMGLMRDSWGMNFTYRSLREN